MIVDPSILPIFFVSAFLVMIISGADMILILAKTVSGGKDQGLSPPLEYPVVPLSILSQPL